MPDYLRHKPHTYKFLAVEMAETENRKRQ